MKVDKVSLELVEYKYLILAAFLGRGLIKDWLDALPDASFRKEAFDVLGKFEDEFQRCFECVRTKYGRPSVLIVKNDFYLAFMGVPLPQIEEHQRRLTRKFSSAPKPALIMVRSVLDRQVPHAVQQSKSAQARALEPMKALLKKHPELCQFLGKKLICLEKISQKYTERLRDAQEKLQTKFQSASMVKPVVAVAHAGAAAVAVEPLAGIKEQVELPGGARASQKRAHDEGDNDDREEAAPESRQLRRRVTGPLSEYRLARTFWQKDGSSAAEASSSLPGLRRTKSGF